MNIFSKIKNIKPTIKFFCLLFELLNDCMQKDSILGILNEILLLKLSTAMFTESNLCCTELQKIVKYPVIK